MPWIIEAWFAASEKTMQSEICPANVEIAASLATYTDVKSNALSLPCRSASSFSRSTVVMAGSRNVARPPPAGSDPIDSFMHCGEHYRMLAHAQVIVGTADGNLILQTMIKGLRKVAG